MHSYLITYNQLTTTSRKLNKSFNSLQLSELNFNAVLEPLTSKSYILVISHNSSITIPSIQLQIRLAKPYFYKLLKSIEEI